MLELTLVEVTVVQRTERRCQAPKCPNERKLCREDLYDDTEHDFARELEAGLGFALHLGQRVSGRKKICQQIVVAIRRKSEVADPASRRRKRVATARARF